MRLGGSRICKRDECSNHSKARGLCWTHGGGKPCATLECSRTSLQGGHCWAHGGGKRCNQDGCQRPAYERNGNYCTVHSSQHIPAPPPLNETAAS
ncbi:hypothetical protein B5M09_009316 [Aphanomyces astaci]|uniref:WRKY19-like zinc finger domain-containing protein n=1 Tax=Aphanomyces astaci TaxID=112090 RepID=A0A425CY47_APHAT|nr:hypothetical protein B5M09_009316 [Aphanomyces astaci]